MPIVNGTPDPDTLDAADGVTNGSDNVIGYGGSDTIYGLGGNDVLRGGAQADRLDGGADRDAADYSDSDVGVFVSLISNRGYNGTAQGDTLVSIETLMGSPFDDWFVGNDEINSLYGRDGDDALKGGGGNDYLYGGNGGDILDGEGGSDTVSYYDSPVGVTISLIADTASGGTATGDQLDNVESIIGSDHGDALTGDNNRNVLQGADGMDTLRGYGADDLLVGGDDTDWLYGMDGPDELYGQGATDWLYGGDLGDFLYGQSGDDRLFGEAGSDRMDGGTGIDRLEGGAANDTFVWHATAETGVTIATMDLIADFNFAAGDRIDLSAVDADVFAPGDQMFTFIGMAGFSGTPGEINYYYSGGNTIIQLQVGSTEDIEGGIVLMGMHTPTTDWFMR
jgi:Ca2+-binding RTX toxin-like protein